MASRQTALLLGMSLLAGTASGADLPDASWNHLPRWRGFNLLEKFQQPWGNRPFVEDDFRWIAGWGFNFVRLPMDYRCWIKDGDWRRFDEATLREIDQAVAWGRTYNIHVLLNFHRAPGYTVAQPPEAKSLWTDPEAQEVCALHWAMFARRYKGIPNRNLSFNLWNEPSGVDATTHAKVAANIVAAIRREDPNRLIICDGLDGGGAPSAELAALHVAQAGRGYTPVTLTHYKADWMGDNAAWPVPTWPIMAGMNAYLYGDAKQEWQSPLTIALPQDSPKALIIHVQIVSGKSTLIVKADGREVWRTVLFSGSGTGEWRQAIFRKEYDVYQNVFDRDYLAHLPKGAREVTIENGEGDWMTFSRIALSPVTGAPGGIASLAPTDFDWGVRQRPLLIDPAGRLTSRDRRPAFDRARLYEDAVTPLVALRDTTGTGVFIGEWGAYRYTPHAVVLAWMKDCLANWKEADLGWALWNFRGEFGVLDSNRSDVTYEDFHGHKLDRAMLDLLRAD